MKAKRMSWTLLIATLIISILAVGMQPVQAPPAGTLALSPNTIYVETGSEPAGWPEFDVNVTITDVTNIVGAVFSIHWDPTILNLTGIVGCPPFQISGYPDYLLPAGGGGISGLMYTVDYAGGNLEEAAQIQLYPFSPKTYTAPNWGWVAELTFEFIGTPPSPGSSINTNITIVDDPGAGMATEWTPDGIAWNDFQTMGKCDFTYVGPVGASPVAIFTWEPVTPLVGEEVTFNASASYDPDGYIVSYDWTFGDTNSGTGETATHTYTMAGTYTVKLTVTDNSTLKGSAEATIKVEEVVVPPAVGADLVKWKARPERHHFDVSAELGKGRDEINTLYALVRNLNEENSTDVKVVFTVYRAADMNKLGTLNATDTLTPGLDKPIEAAFDPSEWGYTGTKIVYKVSATAYYDDGTDWVQVEGAKLKWLKFSVVP